MGSRDKKIPSRVGGLNSLPSHKRYQYEWIQIQSSARLSFAGEEGMSGGVGEREATIVGRLVDIDSLDEPIGAHSKAGAGRPIENQTKPKDNNAQPDIHTPAGQTIKIQG